MDPTKLEPGVVSEWLTPLKDATRELNTCAEEGPAPYPTIEGVELIRNGLSGSIYESLNVIGKDFEKMITAIDAYLAEMIRIDGQTPAEAGLVADNSVGEEAIVDDGSKPGRGPGRGPDSPSGNGGDNGGEVIQPPIIIPPIPPIPPIKPPFSSPLGNYGLAVVENMGTMMDLLLEVATQNGITVETLLTDPQYKEYFNTYIKNYQALASLVDIASFSSPAEMQTWLKSIYNGEDIANIPLGTVDVLRMKLDSIASKKNITAEELLNNVDFASELNETVTGYKKLNTFFSMIDGKGQEVVEQIYNGMVPEAYGFNENHLETFKNALDKLAGDKKLDVMDLLTKPEHADSIKSAFDTLDPTKTLSSLYGDASGATTQTVANNLYQASQIASGQLVAKEAINYAG